MLTEAESAVTVPSHNLMAVVSDAIVDAVRHPRDEDRYQLALKALMLVPKEAWWMLELFVEVEAYANDLPLRWGKLRCSSNT